MQQTPHQCAQLWKTFCGARGQRGNPQPRTPRLSKPSRVAGSRRSGPKTPRPMHVSNDLALRGSVLVSVCSPASGSANMCRKSTASFFCLAVFLATAMLAGCNGSKVSADETAALQQLAPAPQSFIHTVKKGESIPAVLRSYISNTSFMTVAELE